MKASCPGHGAHHYVIDLVGGEQVGTCKHCGAVRKFAFPDYRGDAWGKQAIPKSNKLGVLGYGRLVR